MAKTTVVTTQPKKKASGHPFSAGFQSFLSSLVCILIGLLFGLVVMALSSISQNNTDIGMGFAILFQGPFASLDIRSAFGNVLFFTGPLILTGLSVAIAYKTGLFNIGAPGQFNVGTMLALLIALSHTSTSGAESVGYWLLAILAGIVGGLLWGLIPGALKAFFGINEVIVCIMTNWISANLLSWVFSSPSLIGLVNQNSGKSGYLITTALTHNGNPTFGLDKLFPGSYADCGIVLAILLAVLLYFLLNRTTLGFSMRACGMNKFSARYSGMQEKGNIMFSMGLAGALAGLGGCFYYLNPGIELQFQSAYANLPSYGFNGIPAAFLANCNPIGTIFAALFIQWLDAAGGNLSLAGFNNYYADMIIAVIIYLSGFSRFFREMFDKIKEGVKRHQEAKKPGANGEVPLAIRKRNRGLLLGHLKTEKDIPAPEGKTTSGENPSGGEKR
jgi:simple sugar transport system permease protein